MLPIFLAIMNNSKLAKIAFQSLNLIIPAEAILLFSDLISGLCPDVPKYEYDEAFRKFSFRSLLTLGEVIAAQIKVRAECNKVAAMTLFQAPISKSMRLEEFEQAQGQASSQVRHRIAFCVYLILIISHSLINCSLGWGLLQYSVVQRLWRGTQN